DRKILEERAKKFRSLLDEADTSSIWITDPSLLVSRVSRGIEKVTLQVERLGREWRYGLPRGHVMNSLTEVYRNLIEGALRDFGSIVVIAARAGRGDVDGTFEQIIADGVQAGDVVTELERLGPPC